MTGDLAASSCDACCHSKNVSGGAIGHADKRPAAVAGAISITFCRFSNFTQTLSSQDDIIEFTATLERQSEYSRLFAATESPTQAI
jgi:hypothetical protein